MSHPITEETLNHIATLARLGLTEEERKSMVSDLGRIVEYIETLNTVDTTDVEPLFTVTQTSNVMREDEPKPSLSREEALKNAPAVVEEFVAVPKVLGE